MSARISLHLSLVECPQDRVIARIESSDCGPSEWPAHEFSLPSISAPENAWFNDFVGDWRDLAKAHYVESESAMSAFGERLFAEIFQGNTAAKFRECQNAAKTACVPLRILIDAFGLRLDSIPFELMHDGRSFLVHDNIRIVRTHSTIAGSRPPSGVVRSLLVALADPPDEIGRTWGQEEYALKLRSLLDKIGGLRVDLLTSCSWADFQDKLSGKGKARYDAVYIIAHGLPPQRGEKGKIVFEGAQGAPEEVPAHAIASLLQQNPGCFVYLNSCSTAVVTADNPFGGVAQTLMAAGACGAVLAMQRPILFGDAQSMAASFFGDLVAGENVEVAFQHAIAVGRNYSWAIPCLYARDSGPEQDTVDRARAFFAINNPKTAGFEFRLPAFRLGLPEDEYNKLAGKESLPNPVGFNYKGTTFACADMSAAMSLVRILSNVVPPGRSSDLIQFHTASMTQLPIGSHVFFFGSKSHQTVNTVLQRFSQEFAFEYGDTHWTIKDVRKKSDYQVSNPARFPPGSGELKAAEETDYAIAAKFVDQPNNQVYFVIAGMQARGTLGAAEYLEKNWRELVIKFGDGPFQLLLKFTPGLTAPEVIESR